MKAAAARWPSLPAAAPARGRVACAAPIRPRTASSTVCAATRGGPAPATPWGSAAAAHGTALHPLAGRPAPSSSSTRRRGSMLAARAAADYYQVLGVGRDTDKKAIKAAYR